LLNIQREGKQLRATYLVARTTASPFGFLRAGVIVPRHGQTAVRRNRLKRQLRELTRLRLVPLVASCDVVLRARHEAYRGSFEDLQRDVDRIADQLLKVYSVSAS
jgi:ribonuclease P protein component